jgi:tetratricopeptide (TPR) repeat protein
MASEVTFRIKHRAAILISCASVGLLLYLVSCLVVFRDSDFIEGMRGKAVTNSFAERELNISIRHSGNFYREIAERLQFYQHKPETIDQLYKMAFRKAPGDFRIPSSYAYYLVSRNCCKESVVTILDETIKRHPASWKMHRFAAAYLLSIDQLQIALPHFKRTIELQPLTAQELYKLLEQSGAGFKSLSAVTPDRTAAKLQLAFYLAAKGNAGKQELKNVLSDLTAMPLTPQEKLSIAGLALQAGLTELAEKLASSVLQSKENSGNAYQLLANISWEKGNWNEFEKRSTELQKYYLQTGDRNKAAESALETLNRLASVETKEDTKRRLLKLLDVYPHYAPAYERMANFSQTESEEMALYYWKKAVQAAPDNPEYKNQLAQHYLNQSRIREAEAIYREMISSTHDVQTGYLGLSRCSLSKNDPVMAITILEDGLKKSGKSAELFLELGKVSDSIHDYKRAADAYREFSNLSPDNVEGYILAAEAYRNQGDYNSARELYQQALKRDPQNQHATQWLSLLDSM